MTKEYIEVSKEDIRFLHSAMRHAKALHPKAVEKIEELHKAVHPEENIPTMLDASDINISELTKSVRWTVEKMAEEGYPPKDCAERIFEEALKTFYGKDIFEWWNKAYK